MRYIVLSLLLFQFSGNFGFSGDFGLNYAGETGLVVRPDVQVVDNGYTIILREVFADANRAALGLAAIPDDPEAGPFTMSSGMVIGGRSTREAIRLVSTEDGTADSAPYFRYTYPLPPGTTGALPYTVALEVVRSGETLATATFEGVVTVQPGLQVVEVNEVVTAEDVSLELTTVRITPTSVFYEYCYTAVVERVYFLVRDGDLRTDISRNRLWNGGGTEVADEAGQRVCNTGFSLTAYDGGPLRLSFEKLDHLGFGSMGLDDVEALWEWTIVPPGEIVPPGTVPPVAPPLFATAAPPTPTPEPDTGPVAIG